MFCHKCGDKLPDDAKFCGKCGFSVLRDSGKNAGQAEIEKANVSNSIDHTKSASCQICHSVAPLKYVELNANIGMLVARRRLYIKGNLCKNCINRYFKKYTLTNLFLGWWGLISFFATAVFLISNTVYYLGAIPLKKSY